MSKVLYTFLCLPFQILCIHIGLSQASKQLRSTQVQFRHWLLSDECTDKVKGDILRLLELSSTIPVQSKNHNIHSALAACSYRLLTVMTLLVFKCSCNKLMMLLYNYSDHLSSQPCTGCTSLSYPLPLPTIFLKISLIFPTTQFLIVPCGDEKG